MGSPVLIATRRAGAIPLRSIAVCSVLRSSTAIEAASQPSIRSLRQRSSVDWFGLYYARGAAEVQELLDQLAASSVLLLTSGGSGRRGALDRGLVAWKTPFAPAAPQTSRGCRRA